MTRPRKICIVTGTRAEYGLLSCLMKEIDSDSELQLQIIATGTHLSSEFGLTYQTIEADGFTIDAKVEMLLASDTIVGITKSLGLGVIGFADAYHQLDADIVVLLGDRFEILAAAQAAMIAKIPIAHIHGGETSEGAFDEGIRHALTKMAQWHFVAAEPYRKRVIQMGETPDRVFNVGALGLEIAEKINLLNQSELEKELKIKFNSPVLLVTYHPVTLEKIDPVVAMQELLLSLEQFPMSTIIFTYPNSDTGNRLLIDAINSFVDKYSDRAKVFVSLGQQRYLSLMRIADVVVGNSSSGIIEAPALKTATVNLGDRQKGRLKASSIIDVAEDHEAITHAIKQSLSNEFQSKLGNAESIYGAGDVSTKIKNILKSVTLNIQKSFFDIKHDY